ncbi:glycosyltransferase family 2 protein [Coleofasciculus sp. FACHB-1120]|uniref:glycosyltransferase family 2 protein n=1 Tax=Coleofasciculus sp. FACHB-1120 TaxID=2692783 RepID=UPI001686F0F2|nr:glycosyltransferase family 2 protein [Coleofasciculus sp. FACHB-1120]MBD2743557.1 glycosyltransferase [Coleofasciculus sp. FACHB-1120]
MLTTTTFPIIYAFARSGGTLINRCLGCIPGNIVLSEVNPHASVVPIEVQARDWFKLLSPTDFPGFAKKSYAEKIQWLATSVQQQGSHLIIRDWVTLNFLAKASNDIYVPSVFLEQELYLSHYGFSYRPIVLTRRSADVYESITRTFEQFRNLSVQEFGTYYLAYAQAVSMYPVFHYEIFCQEPEKELKQICDTLGINYNDSFTTEFSKFEYCTGDNTLLTSSRGNKLEKITVMKSNHECEAYLAASLDANCQQADKLLGYENMEVEQKVDALWKIIEFRDKSLSQATDLRHQIEEQWQQTQSQLEQTQSQLEQTQSQLEQTQSQLEQTQTDLGNFQSQWHQSQVDIEYRGQELQRLDVALAQEKSTVQELQDKNSTLEVSLAEQKHLVSHLKEQLHSLNVVRSRLIDELYQSNNYLKYTIEQLQASNNHLHNTVHGLQASNNHLLEELAFLTTNKAAIRKLIKTFLNKTGLYNFIYRNYNLFVPVYNLLFRDRWKPSTIFRSNASISIPPSSEVQTSGQEGQEIVNANIEIDSPSIEAFINARSLGEDVNLETSEFLSSCLAEINKVLCINPSKDNLHFLNLLSKTNTKVTCINSKSYQNNFLAYGFETLPIELSEWMIATDRINFGDYDCLLLNTKIPEETLLLLKGRLSPKNKVMFFGVTSNERLLKQGWDSPERILKDLLFYKTPPQTWLDAFWQKSTDDPLLQWPWNYSVPQVPSTLPSGKPWPKISVVTVSLNQGAYLEETLRSVLLQGYPNLEYIVIDGGSSDNTPTILERYRCELAYCVSEPDRGQSHALNKGFSHATGNILAWLNSDDRYLPGTLFRVAMAFDTYTTDLVAGGCLLTLGNNQRPFKTHHNVMPVGKVVSLPLERLLDIDGSWQKADFFYQPEVFFTREIWERSGAQVDESLFYSMDYELWVRMAYHGANIVHIPDSLSLFRRHEQQKTYGDNLPFIDELKEFNAKFKQNLAKVKKYD